MKILSLNCQRGYQKGLEGFLHNVLESKAYDVFLLQEVDDKVLSFLTHPSYVSAHVFNEEAQAESQVCILYRQDYKLLKTGFQSFSSMRNDPLRGFKHPSFGFLWVDLIIEGKAMRFGSIHLHSGIDRKARMAELNLAKEVFLKEPYTSAILAGDLNTGYPRESLHMARALGPEFIWESKNIGPTLDSRYSENVPHLPNRVAHFLGLFNIRIPLWTDHFFVDAKTAGTCILSCKVLPDKISDHSPVELYCEGK
jgi:endonuclease/exonuclease/phosphatase family metal-dependent hydrolase